MPRAFFVLRFFWRLTPLNSSRILLSGGKIASTGQSTMKYRAVQCLIAVPVALCLFSPAHSAIMPVAEQEPTLMSPMTVIARPITLLVCAVRFRYNLPGAGLRYLVIRKAPQWCAAKGLKVGDRIEAVDGKAIEGQGLIQFTKSSIARKFDTSHKPVHFIFTIISSEEPAPHRIDVTFDDSHGLSIAYP